MGYDVCIWDPARHAPVPRTADEALDTMERLTGVADVWNSSLGAFGVDLEEHFERAPAIVRGHGGVAAFWGADPRTTTAACRTALYRMSLPHDGCSPQLVQVVTAARAHGLVVVDDETGMCFLPDGTIFPEDMRALWASECAALIAAGPRDPTVARVDQRTLLQRLAGELFDALGRGNKRM